MADLAKVKRNVAKMVDAGAPEGEIDSYIQAEGTSIDEVRAFKPAAMSAPADQPKEMSMAENIASKVLAAKEGLEQGVSMGFADEAKAAVGAPWEALFQGKSIPDAYRQLRDQNRGEGEAFRELAPNTAGAYEFAGSMATPFKAAGSVGGRVAQNAGQGALYALGKSDAERTGDQLAEAAQGGAISGAFSLGMEGLSKGVSKLYRQFTGEAANDLTKAQNFVVSKLRDAGKSDDEIASLLQEAGQGSIPRTLGEVTDAPDLLAAQKRFTQDPGKANEVMQSFNQKRFQETIPDTIQGYTQSISPQTSPDVAGMAAKETAGKIVSGAKKARKEAAEPLYEAAKTALVPADQFTALQGDEILGDFIKSTRKDKLFNSRVKDLPDNSVGYLNQVKKRIDSQIGVLKNKGDLERASILMDMKSKLVESLADASPEYRQALDTFSGESTKVKGITDSVIGVLSDMRAGEVPKASSKVFSQTPLQIVKAKSLIVKQDPETWNQLLASHIAKTFDDSRNVEGFIKKLDDTPKLQKQIAAGFSNSRQRQNFNLLINHLREATKIQMRSDTFSNAEAGKMLDQELGNRLAQEVKRGGGIKDRVFNFAGEIVGKVNDRIRMGNSEEVAKILTGKESQALAKKLAGQKPGSPKAIEEIAKFMRNRVPVAATGATMEINR